MLILKKIFIIVCLSGIFASCTQKEDDSSKKLTKSEVSLELCAQLGEQLFVTGGSPGKSTFSKSCCQGLVSITHQEDAANGAAPGRIICASCGDGKCDSKYENTFNCSDCK